MPREEELHCEEYWAALNDGVIRVFDVGTENEYWDFSVFNRGLTATLTKQ